MRVQVFIISYILLDIAYNLKNIIGFTASEYRIPIYFNADSNHADRHLFLNNYQKSFYLVKLDQNKIPLQHIINMKQLIIVGHTKQQQLLNIQSIFSKSDSYNLPHISVYGNRYDCKIVKDSIISTAACVQSKSYWLTKEILANSLDNYQSNKYLNFVISLGSSPFKHQFIVNIKNKSFFFEDDIFSYYPTANAILINDFKNSRIEKFIEFILQIEIKDVEIIDFFNLLKQKKIDSILTTASVNKLMQQLVFLYIENNMTEIAQYIIINNDLKNYQLNNGLSPIHYAIEYNNHKFLEFLIVKGFVPNIYINEFGTTPLMIASQKSDINSIKLLLIYNATPNTCNYFYETPFIIACKNQNFDIANLLIQYKADKFYTKPEWKSCLTISVDSCNLHLIKRIFDISRTEQLKIETMSTRHSKEDENLPFAIYIFYKVSHENILQIHNDIKIYDYQNFIDNLLQDHCLGGVSYQPNIIYCPFEFDISNEGYIHI